MVDRESFRNVREFWIPSIKNLKKKHDIVLVATHVDIRESKDADHVTFDEGFDLCREVNGHTFIECSAADTGFRECSILSPGEKENKIQCSSEIHWTMTLREIK